MYTVWNHSPTCNAMHPILGVPQLQRRPNIISKRLADMN